MSTEAPTPVLSKQSDTRKFHFPPFPAAPEGVTIVPFKDFQEHGIQIQLFEAEDEVERDSLGIATVALRVKHDTDVSKTNPNRKKKSAKEMIAARPGFRKEWWEDWEEGEDLRNHGPYNDNVAPGDRFHHAASDFQRYRKFPPMYTNVQFLWDQFKIFAGLLGTTPVWQKASEKTADDADVSNDESDSEESKSVRQGALGEKRYPPRPRPRAPYELYGREPVVVEDNDDIKGLLDAARATKEDKLVDFLDNPARGIQVFLSSYMKNQGFVFAERNLTNAPHILRFFVNYLLRNKVLPDKTSERSLRAALEIIDTAAVELPLTAKISQALPDEFSAACQGYWGRRADSYVDDSDSTTGSAEAAFEDILKEENVEVIKKEDILPADAPATNTSTPDDDADAPTEGGSEGGSGAWGETAAYDPTDAWDGAQSDNDWAPPALPSLLALLGPTALPLTHAPGVVECSVRRIKAILPPLTNPPPPPAAGEAAPAPDADAVERELEARMHRVVFAPWLGWDGDSSAPRILRSSVGALAPEPDASPASDAPAAAPPTSTARGPKPHDVRADDITVLVGAVTAGVLRLGMGVSGTWVQLARLQDRDADAEAEGGRPKKKLTKAQKERRALRYWYLDESGAVLPSYWLA
ncbi:hypothetical protein DFH09DRAFT_1280454 [Mycena vulgaris]|nr:hypothetical protein DFH09DRAFT_1280454 [Mycena vulgaris]